MPLFPGAAAVAALGLVRLSGDFDPSSTAQTPIIGSLSGASPCNITPATLQWLAATANPTITVATPTSDLPTSAITITGQSPWASATINKTGGGVTINLPAPLSGGAEARFQVLRAGQPIFAAGAFSPVTNFAALWLNPSGAPSTLNYFALNQGTAVNIQGSGTLNLRYGQNIAGGVQITSAGVSLNSEAPSFGGGVGVAFIPNATTVPTVAPSGGAVFYSNSGAFELYATGFQFNKSVTAPFIGQAIATSDVATQPITIASQAPFATATGTNRNPGNVVFNIPSPATGGAEGAFLFKTLGSVILTINTLGLGTTWCSLSMPSGSLVAGNGGLQLTTSGNQIFMQPASIRVASFDSTGIQLCSGLPAYGGGNKVLGVTNCTTNPTTNPAGGVIVYAELSTGHLKNRGSLGAVTTMAPAGSAGTVNSQAQLYDTQLGTCETVSSATPTTIFTYTTVSGKAGILIFALVSRATTAATGIAVGDASMSVYQLGYKNVAGTVTLSTAGITLNGAAQTTASALTSTLSASASGAVITVQVTNPSLCTVDSQVDMTASVC